MYNMHYIMHIPLEIGKKFIPICMKEKIPESKNKFKMQFPSDHSPARSATTHTDRSFCTEAHEAGSNNADYRLNIFNSNEVKIF